MEQKLNTQTKERFKNKAMPVARLGTQPKPKKARFCQPRLIHSGSYPPPKFQFLFKFNLDIENQPLKSTCYLIDLLPSGRLSPTYCGRVSYQKGSFLLPTGQDGWKGCG
jgi:hypothetical protein